MDLIIRSNHDPMLKLRLVAVWRSAMTEIAHDRAYHDTVPEEVEITVASAILSLAATGQTSPGQLHRYAVAQAKGAILSERGDRLYARRSRRRST